MQPVSHSFFWLYVSKYSGILCKLVLSLRWLQQSPLRSKVLPFVSYLANDCRQLFWANKTRPLYSTLRGSYNLNFIVQCLKSIAKFNLNKNVYIFGEFCFKIKFVKHLQFLCPQVILKYTYLNFLWNHRSVYGFIQSADLISASGLSNKSTERKPC